MLSLIVGGEKGGGSQVFDDKATEHLEPHFSFQSAGLADRNMTSNLISTIVENTKQLCNTDKPEAVPAVLTCEDLEQSMLSGITENGSTLAPPVPGWSGPDAKTEKQETNIDDQASQHLLSLLQKGMGLQDIAPSANLGIRSSDKLQNVEVANLGTGLRNPREVDAENSPNSGKPLTLETLFGTAFMKELKSVGAPASSQRGSVGHADVSESHGLPFPVINDPLLTSTVENAPNISHHRSGVIVSNQRQQLKSDRIEGHLLGYDIQNEVDSSQLQNELASKLGGFDGSVEIRLPEEDSLITVSDPLNLQNFIPARNSAKAELSTPETPIDIAEKLAALNPAFRDERPIVGGQEGPPFLRGPFDMREPDVQYHNLHLQPSSPQFHPAQLNQMGPMFRPLDSLPASINAQMKFMAPDNIIHHDNPHHQFPANMLRPPFRHPSTTLTGFEPTTHNSVLQQMHMPGNFPPPHLPRGLPRGTPVPLHPNNQGTGFIQEPNPMQSFPFGQRQPNFGGLGIPAQGKALGN